MDCKHFGYLVRKERLGWVCTCQECGYHTDHHNRRSDAVREIEATRTQKEEKE